MVLVKKRMEAYDSVLTSAPECMYEKGLLPPSKNSGGIGESGRCWPFFVPRPQNRVLANKNVGGIQTIYCLHSRQFGIFECNCMPFGLCSVPATFQRLMQNCLGKLNLIYCLIYLDNIIIFLWTAEEHLHRLCVVFDQFMEYNLNSNH